VTSHSQFVAQVTIFTDSCPVCTVILAWFSGTEVVMNPDEERNVGPIRPLVSRFPYRRPDHGTFCRRQSVVQKQPAPWYFGRMYGNAKVPPINRNQKPDRK